MTDENRNEGDPPQEHDPDDPLDPETREIFERSLRRNRKALERLAEL